MRRATAHEVFEDLAPASQAAGVHVQHDREKEREQIIGDVLIPQWCKLTERASGDSDTTSYDRITIRETRKITKARGHSGT